MSADENQNLSGDSGVVNGCHTEVRDEAVEHIEQFSVQLIHATRQPLEPFGSGILVELDGRYFIFTAGHCVSAYYHQSTIYLKGANSSAPFEAYIREPGAVHADWDLIEDYGFYELDPSKVDAVFDNCRRFLDSSNLCVPDETAFLEAWASGIVSGFPLSMTDSTEQVFESGFLTLNTCPGMVSYSAGNRRKCIDIDMTQMFREGLPADLVGVSGGGFWVLEREESNNPLNLKLAGINVGCPVGDGTGSDPGMIVTLVGHHLRFVADRIDDLKDPILGTWPFLGNAPWATMHHS